ncbi:MAG: hypothetical protein ACWA5K_02180 [bacterium]
MIKYLAAIVVTAIMAWLILGLLFGGDPVFGEILIGGLVSLAAGYLVFDFLKEN